MPNAKVLSEKQAIVAALTEKLQNSAAGVIVDYKGITVAEDTELRAECRKNNIEYAVIKNTLLRFAFNNCGLNELDDQPCDGGLRKEAEGQVRDQGRFYGRQGRLHGDRERAGVHSRPARAAGAGPGHHAGPYFWSGLRAEADCREERRCRRVIRLPFHRRHRACTTSI